MSSHGRRLDHWRASLDAVEELRARIEQVPEPQDDAVTRRLMAQVALAKSSSFVTLLDAEGHVLDVNPAALISGGMDRAEAIGLPLWATSWWSDADGATRRVLEEAVASAAE